MRKILIFIKVCFGLYCWRCGDMGKLFPMINARGLYIYAVVKRFVLDRIKCQKYIESIFVIKIYVQPKQKRELHDLHYYNDR
jgi:hypothetical protein